MTSLTNVSPAASYGDVLTTTNGGGGLTTTLNALQDGLGNNSTITIATNAINFSTTGGNSFQINGVPLTASAEQLNNFANTNYQILTGTLSPTQIMAMSAASIQIIPAPGLGKGIIVDKLVLELIYSGTAYTGGGSIYAQYSAAGVGNGGNTATISQIAAAFLQQTQNSTAGTPFGIGGGTNFLPSSAIVNVPVCITNSTAAFATGNSNVNYTVTFYTINL
jgi:hypothetical protein